MEKQNYGDTFFLQKENWKCILRHLGAFSRAGEAVFPNPTDRPWVSEDAYNVSQIKRWNVIIITYKELKIIITK